MRLTLRFAWMITALATFCVALGVQAQATASTTAPQVKIDGETLEGKRFGDQPNNAVFLGIPFAAPPLGELRWRAPQPIVPREGVQNATEFSDGCLQPGGSVRFRRNLARRLGQDDNIVPDLFPTSEDCLYLNVWTPAWTGGKSSEERLPVMFWIHGGANLNGSSREVLYNGAALTREGVVVVTVNYRLNAFGFLGHPALTAEDENDSSGNQGLLDQIAALRWVERNIAAFGGDPDNVTIFGESAGAANVGYLMASPLARGLFHRAISQSGGYPVTDFRTLEEAEKGGVQLAKKLGVDGEEDVLKALRSKSAEEILEAGGLTTVSINIDGHVLPDAAGRLFQRGEVADVPLLIGWTADEWKSLNYFWPIANRMAYNGAIAFNFGDLTPDAMKFYGIQSDDELADAYDELMTDFIFICPSRFMARAVSQRQNKTWVYVFARTLPGEAEKMGAWHAAELAYVFGNLSMDSWVPYEPYDQELASTMTKAWARFAKMGDPNDPKGGMPKWPAFNGEKESYFSFGNELKTGEGYRREVCSLHDRLLMKKIKEDMGE